MSNRLLEQYVKAHTFLPLIPATDMSFSIAPFRAAKPVVDLRGPAMPLGLRLDFEASDWSSHHVLPPQQPHSQNRQESTNSDATQGCSGRLHNADVIFRDKTRQSTNLRAISGSTKEDHATHSFRQAATALEFSRQRCLDDLPSLESVLPLQIASHALSPREKTYHLNSYDSPEELSSPGSGPVLMPKEIEDDFERFIHANSAPLTSCGQPSSASDPGAISSKGQVVPSSSCFPCGGGEDLFDRVAREQQIFRTLVVTHVECKNHITPAKAGVDYLQTASTGAPRVESFSEGEDFATLEEETLSGMSSTSAGGAKKRKRGASVDSTLPNTTLSPSPEQPERVIAVFEALRQCRWECGGVRVVEPIELTTSPTLASALDENLADWAAPRRSRNRAKSKATTSSKAPPHRSTSVSYLFDDIEPIVLSVHDVGYLSRLADEIEKMNTESSSLVAEHFGAATTAADAVNLVKPTDSTVSEQQRKRMKLFRCVSVTATGDTFASARSLHAAMCAAFSVCRAVDAVVSGEYRNAFCCVRPPGHHAGASGSTVDDSGKLVGQGFCLINNVAVAARYAVANHQSIKKVAVIDWDLHHGNGSQEMFCSLDGPWARDALCDSVLFCSIHGATPPGSEPHLFPGTARCKSRSDGAVNVPLPAGTGHAEFLARFNTEVIAAAEAFKPDLILISAGFDGHKDDLFKFLKLTDRTFKQMTEAVMALAERVRLQVHTLTTNSAFQVCKGRIVSVLEGGYDVPTLVRCCTIHVKALATYKQPLPVVNSNCRKQRPVHGGNAHAISLHQQNFVTSCELPSSCSRSSRNRNSYVGQHGIVTGLRAGRH